MSNVNDYRVVHYYSDDDNCFLAVIPDLPGCISDGKTPEEAVANVRALAQDWIDIALEYGEPVPEPSFQHFPTGDEVSIFDVASYILDTIGIITTKALQKLLYYCKAWSLGWFGTALFPEPFEAWVGGPMNRSLYNKHAGSLMATPSIFQAVRIKELSSEQKQFVDEIVGVYGEIDPDQLGDMTHKETPWVNARHGLEPGERGEQLITDADMIAYYH